LFSATFGGCEDFFLPPFFSEGRPPEKTAGIASGENIGENIGEKPPGKAPGKRFRDGA
jgi:hypothetical protein